MRWTYCGVSLVTVTSVLWACSSSDDGSKVGGTANGGTINVGSGGKASGGSSSTTGGSSSAGTSSGGTSSSAGGSAGTGGDVPAPSCDKLIGLDECGSTSLLAKPKPINIMIVLDKSGSMTDKPFTGVNKWDATKSALSSALAAAEPSISFGLILYPFNATNPIPELCDKNCCDFPTGEAAVNVPIEPAPSAVPKIKAALDGTAPGGGTPTAAALSRALDYYTTGAGATLQGDRYVLLATDGGPNCNTAISCTQATCTTKLDGNACSTASACCPTPAGNGACLDDVETKKQIEALKAAGVSTFVVGIPGTDAYEQYLNDFAVAGGVPNTEGTDKYFRVSAAGGVEGLTAVFTKITANLIKSCDVEMTQVPPEPDKVNIAINCEVLPKEEGKAWDFDAADPKLIKIKDTTCEFIQNKGVQRIDVVFGCPTVSIR